MEFCYFVSCPFFLYNQYGKLNFLESTLMFTLITKNSYIIYISFKTTSR